MKRKNFRFLTVSACLTLAAVIPAATVLSACGGNNATLQNISVTTPPDKVEYKVGESFSPAGMVITAEYDTADNKAVTNYTYAPTGALTFDDTSVIITYSEGDVTKTCTQNITVVSDAELSSIEITAAPSKTVYTVGDKFNKAGMVVTAKYDNDTSRAVTGYTFEPAGELALTDTEVTVSYTENNVTKTAKQAITVNNAALNLIRIDNEPKQLEYNLGDTFNPDGMVVTAVYSNGKSQTIDNSLLTVPGKLGTEDTALTVSYTEGGITKSATLNKKILIEAPEVTENDYEVAEELLFSDAANYELEGGASKSTWSTQGFDRLRCNTKAEAKITFAHDFTELEDKTQAGLRVIMSAARGGTTVKISTDNKQTWQTVSEAGEGLNMLPADYKHPSSTIDGRPADDRPNRNVYYCYFNLGKFMTEETGTVYIQFGYENPSAKGWAGPDVEGADLMHSIVFYNRLDLAKITGELELKELTVKTQPTKTAYTVGDLFDSTGLVLDAEWADGTHTDITKGFIVNPATALAEEDTKVTVTYAQCTVVKSVEIEITVTPPSSPLASIAITNAPAKTVYTEGEAFDPAGMVVTATFEDGNTQTVAGFTVTPDGALTSDITEITVEFQGKTATQAIRVKQTALHDEDKVVAAELMFTDTNNYTLEGGAAKGASRQFTDGKGEAVRLRANKNVNAKIVVQYTFGDGDLSQAGFMFYGLHTRMGTVVQISTDGENWQYLFKAEEGMKNIQADWKEKANNIVNPGTDANMYSMYYDISDFITEENKTVYIRFGYEAPEATFTDSEGADIFGSVTFYTKLDLAKVL